MNYKIFYIPKSFKIKFINPEQDNICETGYYDYKNRFRKTKNNNNSWDSLIEDSKLNLIENNLISSLKISNLNREFINTLFPWNLYTSDIILEDFRGFSIRIPINNFLWLLKFCKYENQILSGNFIYAWDKNRRLVILPKNSEEYETSIKIFRGKNNIIKKKEDLVPGSLYKIKNLNQYSFIEGKFIEELIFIGTEKVIKNLKLSYESFAIFYLPKLEEESNRDLIFFIKLSDIEYRIKSNVLNKKQIDSILHRFKLTAYSLDFWKNKNLISEFFTENNKFNEFYKYGKIEETQVRGNLFEPVVVFNSTKTEFDFYKIFISFSEDKGSNNLSRNNTRYLSYRFQLKEGNLQILKKFIDLGHEDKSVITKYYYLYGSKNKLLNSKLIYKNATDLDINSVKDDSFGSEKIKGTMSKIFYKTADGYISESLQILFALNNLTDNKEDSVLSCRKPYYLPIKI